MSINVQTLYSFLFGFTKKVIIKMYKKYPLASVHLNPSKLITGLSVLTNIKFQLVFEFISLHYYNNSLIIFKRLQKQENVINRSTTIIENKTAIFF